MGGHFKLELPTKTSIQVPHSISSLLSVSLGAASLTPATIVQNTHTSLLQKPAASLRQAQNRSIQSSTTHQGKSASAAYRQSASRPDL